MRRSTTTRKRINKIHNSLLWDNILRMLDWWRSTEVGPTTDEDYELKRCRRQYLYAKILKDGGSTISDTLDFLFLVGSSLSIVNLVAFRKFLMGVLWNLLIFLSVYFLLSFVGKFILFLIDNLSAHTNPEEICRHNDMSYLCKSSKEEKKIINLNIIN